MKLQQIVHLFGEGSLAITVGSVLLGIGLAEALTVLVPQLATWAAYLIVGGIGLVIGGLILSRGVEKAEQKVDKVEERVEDAFDVKQQVASRPWVAIGIAIASGLVLARLLPIPLSGATSRAHSDRHRGPRREGEPEPADTSRHEGEREDTESWGTFLGDQLSGFGHTLGLSAVTVLKEMAGPKLLESMLGGLGFEDTSRGPSDEERSRMEHRQRASAGNGHNRH